MTQMGFGGPSWILINIPAETAKSYIKTRLDAIVSVLLGCLFCEVVARDPMHSPAVTMLAWLTAEKGIITP